MRAHVIENGIVVNTIEVDNLDALPNLVDASRGGIGDVWDGENFTSPSAPEPAPAPPPPTKEELLAQLQALQAQITALGD
jgi:hypothetical protein